MVWLEKLFSWLEWAIPGFFGAVFVYLVIPSQRQELRGRKDVMLFLASGGIISHFMTKPVTGWLHVTPESVGGIGFLLGAFGGALCTAIMRGINASDLWALAQSIIKAKFGGGSQ